jgi:tetratricopeptide (TPR) repeat protein
MVSGVSARLGEFDRAGTALERGRQSLHGDAVQRARLQSDLGWCRHRAGRWQEARVLYDVARPVLESAGQPRLLAQCLDRLSLSWIGDDPDLALSLADRALVMARESGAQELTAVVVMHRAECLGLCGRTAEALVELDAATAWFAASRDHYMQSVTQWVRAKVLVQHGDLAGALDARDAEIALLEQVGNAPHLVTAHLHRAELLTALGKDEEDATAALDQARVVALDSGDSALVARVDEALVPAGRIREG